MKLWRVHVGGGRFIVQAWDEESAIAIARVDAEEYWPTQQDVQRQETSARLLEPKGEPAVLEADFS